PVDAENDADDDEQGVQENPDIASEHVEIIQEENGGEQEHAERGSRQQCRPEGDGKPAEIRRILRCRVRFENPAEDAAAAEHQHRRRNQGEESGAEHGLELELEYEL